MATPDSSSGDTAVEEVPNKLFQVSFSLRSMVKTVIKSPRSVKMEQALFLAPEESRTCSRSTIAHSGEVDMCTCRVKTEL